MVTVILTVICFPGSDLGMKSFLGKESWRLAEQEMVKYDSYARIFLELATCLKFRVGYVVGAR